MGTGLSVRRDTTKPIRICIALGVFLALSLAWPAPPASARHNLSMLRLAPAVSVPGGEVAVSGFSYTRPVSIHFNTLNGPVLGTYTPDSNSDLRGTVTIPADTKPGDYLLLATQDDSGKPTRIPARARLTVVGTGGAPVVAGSVQSEPRAPTLIRKDEEAITGSLVLAGLGAAGAAMFVVGGALVFVARRRPAPSSTGAGS